MNRTLLLVATTIALAAAATTLAHPIENGEQVKIVDVHKLAEKLDGKDADVTVVEVTIDPGKAGLPHRHPGPALVYVIEGEYELGIDNKPTKIFKAGQSFQEPSGCLHSVSRNPSKTTRTRLVAFVLHPRDAKEVAIPEPMDESHHAPGASH
jgi:quercetin dioxygenase-like cupin family protein